MQFVKYHKNYFFWGDLELLCFIFIKKIDRFKSPFPKITSLSGLTLNTIDLHCYYKYRKWFLWVMLRIQAVVIHRNEWSLTWYFWWEIYTSIPNLNPHSQNLVPAEKAPRSKYPLMKHLWYEQEHHRIYHKKNQKCKILCNIPFQMKKKVNGNWDNKRIRISILQKNKCLG